MVHTQTRQSTSFQKFSVHCSLGFAPLAQTSGYSLEITAHWSMNALLETCPSHVQWTGLNEMESAGKDYSVSEICEFSGGEAETMTKRVTMKWHLSSGDKKKCRKRAWRSNHSQNFMLPSFGHFKPWWLVGFCKNSFCIKKNIFIGDVLHLPNVYSSLYTPLLIPMKADENNFSEQGHMGRSWGFHLVGAIHSLCVIKFSLKYYATFLN